MCLLLLGFAVVPPLQAAVEVSATLNPKSFPIDRAAALNIKVKGVRSFKPVMPEVDGLLFHQRGKSTQMEFINGAYAASVTLTYLVQADRVGRFNIPAIQINTNEGIATTNPVSFTVIASQVAPVAQQGKSAGSSTARLRSGDAEKLAFLRVQPAKEQSYTGEIVPVQIKVYFRDGLKANLNSLPQLHGEGYILQQLAREPVQTRELIENIPYAVLTWDSALSGIKEGEHTLSVEIAATLLLPEQHRGSPFGNTAFNDPFFNNFFSSYREKDVQVASPPLQLAVLPLPKEGKPDDFNGAIGNFRLSVTASPVDIVPGDPITLIMTVSGEGNFDRVQAPTISTEKGWKTYTPSSEFLKDGGPGQGKKVFEQALVARDSSLSEIPPILFSYFDPAAAAYKTLKTEPIALTINGGKVAPEAKKQVIAQTDLPNTDKAESVHSVQEVVPPVGGLAPMQLVAGNMDQQLSPLFARKWFQILIVLLLLGIATVVVVKVRAARLANNPRLQRDLAMKHLLDLREKEIDQALAANDTRGFLSSCRKTIQEQLGLLWDVEAGAITLADLRKRLSADSVLLEVFSAADESAYGGQELNQQQMQAFADHLKKELEGLA